MVNTSHRPCRRPWRAWGLALGLCAPCATVSAASASTVIDRGLEGLCDLAERVVVARVVSQTVRVEVAGARVRVTTLTTLDVEETLMGPDFPAQVTLEQPGGSAVVDGRLRHHRVDGAATFEPGERAVVFLERTAAGRLVVAGMALGKFSLAQQGSDGEDAPLVRGAVATVPGGPRVTAGPEALTLSALRRRVARAAASHVVTPAARVRR